MSNEITTPYDRVLIDPNEPLILPDGTAITGRLETFLYALCCLDYNNLPTPLSRIEEFANALITGEIPNIEPQSRSEQFFLAILDGNIDNLPEPQSRSEVLLNKLAVGDFDLTNVDPIQSRYELLLAYLIKNGGVGNLDYVLYEFYQATQTLYNTQEKPVKSAILKGNTGYRDIDTGEFLETFEEGRNLELVSVKMPVLKTVGKNLVFLDKNNPDALGSWSGNGSSEIKYDDEKQAFYTSTHRVMCSNITFKPNTYYIISAEFLLRENNSYSFNWQNPQQSTGTTYSGDTPFNETTWIRESIKRLSDNDGKIDWIVYWGVWFRNLQIEEAESLTTYEPYKSNILSTSEDVVLRGIGGVQDTLDCLTGEVTERVGEIVLNGSEDWWIQSINSYGIVNFKLEGINYKDKPEAICNILKRQTTLINDTTDDGFFMDIEGVLFIRLSSSKCGDVDGLKLWLQQNNVIIQYELNEKSIKTVDLSVIDQNGNVLPKIKTFNDTTHVNVSSDGISPKVEMEVATYNEEDITNANVMTASMDEIYSVQNELDNTNSIQSEEIDSTMIASTEIYENIL